MQAHIPNQKKIIELLIQGLTPKEIAYELKGNQTCVNEILRLMRDEYNCRTNVQLAIKYDRNELPAFKHFSLYSSKRV